MVLDRTAFFPEGGGQYADTGRLRSMPEAANKEDSADVIAQENESIRVLDVQEEEKIIYHITDKPLKPGERVFGELDWNERFMKMQQHTGEHIVSGLVHKRFGYNNVGFHLGSEDSTMDFNGEITREELHEIECAANDAVIKNLDVQAEFPSQEELKQISYRSKIEIEGSVRIVTIPGYDICACCAPHVKKTGEIGLIKLTNVQRYKGGVRVTMLCGFRALADYTEKAREIRKISALLCAKEQETAEAVAHLKEECTELKNALARQRKKQLEFMAQEIDAAQPMVCMFAEDIEGEEPRLLMNLILERGAAACAVFSKAGSAAGTKKICADEDTGMKENCIYRDEAAVESYRYVIGSGEYNLQSIAKELNGRFQGRGGGKPNMVQGSLQGRERELREWMEEKWRVLYDARLTAETAGKSCCEEKVRK